MIYKLRGVLALLFVGLATPAAGAERNIVGKECRINWKEIIIRPIKLKVRKWPSDPNVRRKLSGLPAQRPLSAKAVYETIYNLDESGPWHNKPAFIMQSGDDYFLITAEGVKTCK